MQHPRLSAIGYRLSARAGLPLLLLLAPSHSLRAQPPSLQFSSLAFTVRESTSLARITVNRLGGATGTVTVDFTTLDSGGGNATAGQDYMPTNGTLTFGPGVTSRYFYVPIINDTAHEQDEGVILELSNPSEGAGLGGQPNTTLTITDNDVCTYSINPTARTHDELGGAAQFEVLAPTGCVWTAQSTAAWIGIIAGSGSGNGTVNYSYDPLPGEITTRTGTIQVAGKMFTVTQAVPPVDLTPPTISFMTPAQGSRQTNTSIMVTGRASDGVEVTLVEVRLENASGTNDYAPATGTATWSASVDGLVPGTNTIRVRARDAADNLRETNRAVWYVQVRPLSLARQGNGTVSPLTHGQLLDVGKNYTILAKAAVGHFFSSWSGSVDSRENPLTFQMQPDFALQANFVSSPFGSVAGAYSGLFYESGSVRHESSGSLQVTVGALGTFSARMILGGKRASFSGRFGLDGMATNTLALLNSAAPVHVMLGLDLTGGTDAITGSVGNGTWQSSVTAYRDVFDGRTQQAPQFGRYTLVMPGNLTQATNQPGGDGFGTLKVGADGTATLSGALADGTRLAQRAAVSKDGYWPLYIPLYGMQGAVLGWVHFADVPNASDLDATLTWLKPPSSTAKYYPGGFSIQPSLTGSRYVAPTNEAGRVLNLTDGHVTFAAGNLPEIVEKDVSLSATGIITNHDEGPFVFAIQKSGGLFTGSVTPPGSSRPVPFRGAVHQKGNFAAGFFLGTNQGGSVKLISDP